MPELVANGPNIPVQLMNELDSGRVVFFCGAGVSAVQGSGLPTFADLVHRVYDAHHMDPNDIEREALDRGGPKSGRRRPNFDKALGLLEKRLGAQALRATVIEILSTPRTGPLKLHKALIELSRCENGNRLVTTNFDNRFVEAGLVERLVDAAPKLPVPVPHRWSSLVHLHGRIVKNDDGSNLVLTAADFGRAYLAERWAARFVTELFREFVVVFVGYSVGDPVMSYLVDALAAERAKGAKFTMAYAFAEHGNTDSDCRKARDGWLAKNIEPILYNKRYRHSLLKKTLIEWARIRSDPFHARSQIVLNGMSKLPAGPDDPMVERVAWALQNAVAAQALAEAPPFVNEDDFPKVEGWLEVLAEKGLLGCVASSVNPNPENQDPTFVPLVGYGFEPQYSQELKGTMKYLVRWIARHLHVPQLLAWVIRSGGYLHPQLRQQLRTQLANSDLDIPSKLRLLWTVLLSHEPVSSRQEDWTVENRLAKASESERRHIQDETIESVAPRLVVCPGPAQKLGWQRYSDEKPKPIPPIDVCGHLVLVSGDKDSLHKFGTTLKDPTVLSRHAETLTNYLDHALALMEDADDAISDSSLYRPSIAAHDQNRNNGDWTILIDLARDSYFALAKADRVRGDNLLRRWVLSKEPLFKRLALHALTENFKSDIQLARKLLVVGRWPGIWTWELNREVLRFLRMAGRRLPRSLRAEIVRAIHNGPKTKSKNVPANFAKFIRREKALRLYKLMASGTRLDKNSKALAEEVEASIEEGSDEHDEFRAVFKGPQIISATEFAPKELRDGSINDIATELKNGEINNYEFQGLAQSQPVKVAIALRRLSDQEEWPARFWKGFLWVIAGTHDGPQHRARLRKYVAQLLATTPDELFTKVDSAAAAFIKNLAEEYGIDHEQELRAIWTKAWRGACNSQPEAEIQDDLLTVALNHGAGKLADAALIRLRKYKPRAGEGLPSPVREYFDTIVDDPNGKLGRIMFAASLYSLFIVDRDWVENNLIPRLSLQSSNEARDLWVAYGHSPPPGPDLLLAFKKPFFDILRDTQMDHQSRGNLTGLFMAICLEAPNELKEREIHGVIGSLPEETLPTVIRSLTIRLRGNGNDAERARIWRNKLSTWLQQYWPTAEDRNTAATSKAMLGMLAECGDAFEDAAAWLLNLLQPLTGAGLYSLSRYDHAVRHPGSMLLVLDKVVAANAFPDHQKPILREILDTIRAANGNLRDDRRFHRLYSIAVG